MRITIVAISLAGFLTSLPSASRASDLVREQPLLPALPSVPKTGVALFREMLGMTPAQRETALASFSENKRKTIASRLKEFDALQPDEREMRLERMKLRSSLIPLLSAPPAQRKMLYSDLPEEERRSLTDRLQLWDQLGHELQRQVLENEGMLNCIMPVQTVSSNQLQSVMLSLPESDRQKIATNWQRFQQIPPKQREKMYENYRELFDLNETERLKVLSAISESERQELDKTLKAIQTLPKPQRDQCLVSFNKFANMSPYERALFLKNAEQWKTMSAEKRQSWRSLVNVFPPMPPTPPGMRTIPQPPPPLPSRTLKASAVTTSAVSP
ncbi:MAG TPA: DUF3106 domain-containing protein [Candidatus Saccharimonadales bacterium]|nr:DUF3106 domain-containing protein [Candidatus Saccharimonadales bacterium]